VQVPCASERRIADKEVAFFVLPTPAATAFLSRENDSPVFGSRFLRSAVETQPTSGSDLAKNLLMPHAAAMIFHWLSGFSDSRNRDL
jgi:hypothetical protein